MVEVDRVVSCGFRMRLAAVESVWRSAVNVLYEAEMGGHDVIITLVCGHCSGIGRAGMQTIEMQQYRYLPLYWREILPID
jgi:hypothetical protein